MKSPCLRDTYRLYVCPDCGDSYQYAGWCDSCHSRLSPCSVVPVAKIIEARDETIEASSPVPAEFVSRFVARLLTPSSPTNGRG